MIDFSVRFHVWICSFIRWLQTQSLFLSLLHLQYSKSPNRKGTVATWGWPWISVPNPRVWPSQLKWGKGSKDRIELKDQDNFYLENIKEKATHQLFFHKNTRLNGLPRQQFEQILWRGLSDEPTSRRALASTLGFLMGAHVHRWLASWISSPFKGDLRQMLPLQRLGICKCRWPGVAVECHSLWDRNHWSDMLDGQNPPIRMLQTCNSWTSIDSIDAGCCPSIVSLVLNQSSSC